MDVIEDEILSRSKEQSIQKCMEELTSDENPIISNETASSSDPFLNEGDARGI